MLVKLIISRLFLFSLIPLIVIGHKLNVDMGSEAENLDKCFEVVSDIVQKAGDVSCILYEEN